MKRISILAITSIVTVLVVSFVSCCGIDTSSPEGTVRSYQKAWASYNVSDMADCQSWGGSMVTREKWIEETQKYFTSIRSTTITNQQISIESQDDTTATIVVTFDYHEVLDNGDERDYLNQHHLEKYKFLKKLMLL